MSGSKAIPRPALRERAKQQPNPPSNGAPNSPSVTRRRADEGNAEAHSNGHGPATQGGGPVSKLMSKLLGKFSPATLEKLSRQKPGPIRLFLRKWLPLIVITLAGTIRLALELVIPNAVLFIDNPSALEVIIDSDHVHVLNAARGGLLDGHPMSKAEKSARAMSWVVGVEEDLRNLLGEIEAGEAAGSEAQALAFYHRMPVHIFNFPCMIVGWAIGAWDSANWVYSLATGSKVGTDETPPDAEAWAETIESAVQLEREPVLVYVLWRYAADAGKHDASRLSTLDVWSALPSFASSGARLGAFADVSATVPAMADGARWDSVAMATFPTRRDFISAVRELSLGIPALTEGRGIADWVAYYTYVTKRDATKNLGDD